LGQNTPAPGGPTLNVAPPALPPGNVGAPGTTPPPSLPDTTTAPTGAAGEYKVAKGDLGTTIAKKNGVSLKALVAANPTVNWSRLRIGQVIQIPAGSTPPATKGTTPAAATTDTAANAGPTSNYTVRPGDTGTKIATKHNVKWAAIRKANNLKSDSLHPGQVLVIPGRAASATGNEPAAGAATPSAAPVAPIAIPLPPASAPGPAPR
jgi:LysM repeat protein